MALSPNIDGPCSSRIIITHLTVWQKFSNNLSGSDWDNVDKNVARFSCISD